MTAEIAVMNKSAVALAADSKVTISGMSSTKAYDTVNKLFTLSKSHPVGFMIFGNAEFMDYPWETIVKLYRKKKGSDSETHISKWGADFCEFLKDFGAIDDKHKRRNISIVCASWLRTIADAAMSDADEAEVAIGSPEFIDILIGHLDRRIFFARQKDVWADKAEMSAIKKRYRSEIKEAVDSFSSGFSDDRVAKKARSFLTTALSREDFSPHCSGFVVAGFGDDEYFPTVIEYYTDGYIGDRIKISSANTTDVSRDMSSCIRSFAQGDMVQRFMNGIDGQLHQAFLASFVQMMTQGCESILEKYGDDSNKTDAVKAEIHTAIAASVKTMITSTMSYMQDKFSNPVIRMVAMLPKDELAHLAESLVALTSLKRRVSSDAETVGGPVDVALISKGDGFVWIKRKLYFPVELNPHFGANYMLGANFGEPDHA